MLKTASPPKQATELALDSFWETIPPLWGRVRAHIRATAREDYRLGVEQFQVLRLIRHGTNSVSEIAAARNISRPAVSQAVDVLASRGLLTRTEDSQDRRHTRLALSESGNEVLDALFDETRRWMRAKLAGLSRTELERISGAMVSLQKLLE